MPIFCSALVRQILQLGYGKETEGKQQLKVIT
jgi:hypothetical protein